jgi:hypothetical protein
VLWPQRITPKNYQNIYRRSLHLNTSTTNLNLQSTTVPSTHTIPLTTSSELGRWSQPRARIGTPEGEPKEPRTLKLTPGITRKQQGKEIKLVQTNKPLTLAQTVVPCVSIPSSQHDSHTRTGTSRPGKSTVGFARKDQTRTIHWNAWGGQVTVRTTASTPGVAKFLTSRNPFSIVSKLAHECCEHNRGTALLIPNLGTRWWRVVSLMPQLHYPWEKFSHQPLYRGLAGPQSWSGHLEGDKNILPYQNVNLRSSTLQDTH